MAYDLPPGIDLWQIPYQQPPPGLTSDFDKPSDLRTLFRVLIPIIIAVTTLFLTLRIRARFGRDERWRTDDFFAIAAWAVTTALGILLIVSVQKLGRSTWNISLGFLLSAWPQRILVCMAFLCALALLLGKLCLLTLYYRIFGHIDHVRHQLYITGAFCFPLLAACIIFPILASPPPGKPWGTPNPHNKENSITTMAIGIVNIIADLLILYIPIPSIVTMNLSRRKKAGVLAIFLTGSIAIVADAVVMYYRVRLYQQIDPLRDGMVVGLCSFIEACISIVCSSMPSAAKVWKVHIVGSDFFFSLRSRFGSRGSTHNSNNSAEEVRDEIQYPEAPKKKRRGLYSIGTLPTTNHSATRLDKTEFELKTLEERSSGQHSASSSRPENGDGGHGPVEYTLQRGSLDNPSLKDPSNYLQQA